MTSPDSGTAAGGDDTGNPTSSGGGASTATIEGFIGDVIKAAQGLLTGNVAAAVGAAATGASQAVQGGTNSIASGAAQAISEGITAVVSSLFGAYEAKSANTINQILNTLFYIGCFSVGTLLLVVGLIILSTESVSGASMSGTKNLVLGTAGKIGKLAVGAALV